LHRLYIIPEAYNDMYRSELIDILKPFWGKGSKYDDLQRQATYGISAEEVEFVGDVEDADYAVLPLSWNYYYEQNKKKKALECVRNAFQKGKTTISFTSGDFGIKIPSQEGLVVLRLSGNRSEHPDYHIGMPAFVTDPLPRHFNKSKIEIREYSEKPSIGFCGQAKANTKQALTIFLHTLKNNLRRSYCNQPLSSYTSRRSRALNVLESSSLVSTSFIKNDQYRGGATTTEERRKSARNFYQNINDSDYTLCLRGRGNFSVRLYETLAMGRIPIFVNTDCILPFANIIKWREHVLWLEEKMINLLPELVLEYHRKHTAASFRSQQLANRRLWENELSLGGFWRRLLSDQLPSMT